MGSRSFGSPSRVRRSAAGPRHGPGGAKGERPERRYDGPHVQPIQIGFAESGPVYEPESAEPAPSPSISRRARP